jgi:NADH-quinone oxidoreductase subunit C
MILRPEEQSAYIKNTFKVAAIEPLLKYNNLIIYVAREKIIELLGFLRDDDNLSFKILLDIFGADMLEIRSPRFEVIYNLLSIKLNSRITVKVAVEEGEEIMTATSLFSSAGWFERETFDMYGIVFLQHPDLRRILTDYDFEGHPLRKDFPLTGYKEVHYDPECKKVVYRPVKMMQEFRNFDLEMPWEGTNYRSFTDKIKK